MLKANVLLVRADHGEDIGMMFEGPSQFYEHAPTLRVRHTVWEKSP